MELRSIKEVEELRGRYVLLRASLNIPLKEGLLRDRFRLRRALPTLLYLREKGARTVVISHIGRDPGDTLLPVLEAISEEVPVIWGGDVTEAAFREKRKALADGDILLAENLRRHAGEEANDAGFCALLADMGDLYVNDAFAEAHREHASTLGVAQMLPAYAGLTLEEEVAALEKAASPRAPSLFILGGAKFDTKLPLVEKYLERYDHVFIGGALAHDVLKAKGYEVGRSLVSDVPLAGAAFLDSEKLLLPVDVVVEGASGRFVKTLDAVLPEDVILDAGPLSLERLAPYVREASTILWNGPLGNYEAGYTEATEGLARLMADSQALTIVGGGDTVAAIETLGLNEKFGFVSIGGGALLTFLEHGTTPALELLKKDRGRG